jgi:thiamine kinase-like enzyme
MAVDPRNRAAELPLWSGSVDPEPLAGGLSNESFVVRDRGERFVVRIGDDLPFHHVDRARELAMSRAAFLAGLAPEVIAAYPGALVIRYIEGARPLTPADVQNPATLARIVPLLHRCHREVPGHLRGAAPFFWVFHVFRDYAITLREGRSRWVPELGRLVGAAEVLERAVGPIEIVFGHNDLIPANLIDDGRRLWLVDWEYAGYGSPLFDLGGLACNGELSEGAEERLLEAYFERAPDDGLRRRYAAMRCAALLREAEWGMVSELHLPRPIDYASYGRENLARFERAYAEYHRRWESA